MQRPQLEDLWSRYLAGAPLTDDERATLDQAIRADAEWRRTLAIDRGIHGALREMGRSASQEERFASRFVDLIAAENRSEDFLKGVQSRIRKESRAQARSRAWRWGAVATVYHYRLGGLIEGVRVGDILQYQNVADSQATGMEFELQGRPLSRFETVASLALQKAVDSRTEDLLVNSPHKVGKLRLAVPPSSNKLRLSGALQYLGRRKTLAEVTARPARKRAGCAARRRPPSRSSSSRATSAPSALASAARFRS